MITKNLEEENSANSIMKMGTRKKKKKKICTRTVSVTATPIKTDTQDTHHREQAKYSCSSGYSRSTACRAKCDRDIQAACFMLKIQWNHKMTTFNRYLFTF